MVYGKEAFSPGEGEETIFRGSFLRRLRRWLEGGASVYQLEALMELVLGFMEMAGKIDGVDLVKRCRYVAGVMKGDIDISNKVSGN